MIGNRINNAAWGMFLQTGQIGYYLLSKKLSDDTEEDERLR
jgi:hypothetical protein